MTAQKTIADLDFVGKYSTRNRLDDPVSSDPAGLGAGDEGRVWVNTTTHKWKYWNGTTAIDPVARGNHTGTQLASTISDLATTVKAYRLDEFANATNPLTGVSAVSANHLVIKSQLDAVAAAAATGTAIKDPVRVASTASVTIGSTGNGATIDGVTIATGDRVLLKDQSTGSQNGIYDVGASALTRSADMDATGEVKPGTMVFVTEGTANHDKTFAVTSVAVITVGSTTITWGQIGAGTTYSGTDPISVSGGVISLLYGTGLTLSGSNLVPDFTVVGRKVTGVIPTSSSGIVTVSGATVTINHGLNNWGADLTLTAYTSPYTGYSQGDRPLHGAIPTDANNLQVVLPAAPASNNWHYSIVG